MMETVERNYRPCFDVNCEFPGIHCHYRTGASMNYSSLRTAAEAVVVAALGMSQLDQVDALEAVIKHHERLVLQEARASG